MNGKGSLFDWSICSSSSFIIYNVYLDDFPQVFVIYDKLSQGLLLCINYIHVL